MLLRFLLRSIGYHRARLAIGLAAVAVACGAALSMAQVAADGQVKLRRELRVFGANVALLPAEPPATGFAAAVDVFATRSGARACSPVLERVVRSEAGPVALVGVRWPAAPHLFAYWQLEGRDAGWPAGGARGVCLLGRQLARTLRVRPHETLELEIGKRKVQLRVLGTIRSGDSAESQCFISLDEAVALAGTPGLATAGLAVLDGDAPTVESQAAAASAGLPALTARPIRGLAAAEGVLLGRAHWLMLATGAAVLLLAALAVLTTTHAAALDRERELALLKALGWDGARIARLFILEAALTGLAAGAAGAVLAALAAPPLAMSLLGGPLTPRPLVLLAAPPAGLLLTIAGAWAPARRVLRLDPMPVLRSE